MTYATVTRPFTRNWRCKKIYAHYDWNKNASWFCRHKINNSGSSFSNCWDLQNTKFDESILWVFFIYAENAYLQSFNAKNLHKNNIFRFDFVCCPILYIYVLSPALWCMLRFPHKHDGLFFYTSSWLYDGSCLIYVTCACLRNVLCFCFVCTSCCVPYVICVCLHIVVSNQYCVMVFFNCFFFVLCTLCWLPVSLDCPFVIAPSVFSNGYLTFHLLGEWNRYPL